MPGLIAQAEEALKQAQAELDRTRGKYHTLGNDILKINAQIKQAALNEGEGEAVASIVTLRAERERLEILQTAQEKLIKLAEDKLKKAHEHLVELRNEAGYLPQQIGAQKFYLYELKEKLEDAQRMAKGREELFKQETQKLEGLRRRLAELTGEPGDG